MPWEEALMSITSRRRGIGLSFFCRDPLSVRVISIDKRTVLCRSLSLRSSAYRRLMRITY